MKKTVLITILLITAAAVKAMAGHDSTAAEAPKVRFTYFFETRMGADMVHRHHRPEPRLRSAPQ